MAEKVNPVEAIKAASNNLRGSLATDLNNGSNHFDESGKQLLKFHGLYQQDDRDQRKVVRGSGEKPYSFMLRTRLPGGQLTAEQYIVHDDLATRYANDTLRITTRQCFQFHGLLKGDLKATLQGINDALITSLGACGDVVRNVVCCPAPIDDPIRRQIETTTRAISDHLLPRTRAYHEIWLDDEKVYDGEKLNEDEPIYGKTYLPRKFKIAIAYPGDNCVDVYTQDIGLVAVADGDALLGFNVLVGGGMGMNHTKADTFPRLGDPLGFVLPEQVVPVIEEIVKVQRDYGNRTDRKHARMKYLVHNWGVERFRGEVEARLGYALQPFAPMPPLENELHLGWQEQGDGRWYLGVSVENGRIADVGDRCLKSGLRAVVEKYRCHVRLTPNHDILLCGFQPAQRPHVDALLAAHGVTPAEALSNVQLYSMACVALPTCGLAVAESERALPGVIDDLEATVAQLGLADERISVRMTGCPNGCARPYVADIGLVGRSYDQYVIMLGGRSNGTRLNETYKDLVRTQDLVAEVRPLLVYFKQERQLGERFGDFCQRIGTAGLLAYAEHALANGSNGTHSNGGSNGHV
jgi:sulfite reductase (ferredoxin)